MAVMVSVHAYKGLFLGVHFIAGVNPIALFPPGNYQNSFPFETI